MLEDIRKKNVLFEGLKEAGMKMSLSQQVYYDDTTDLISLIDKYKKENEETIRDFKYWMNQANHSEVIETKESLTYWRQLAGNRNDKIAKLKEEIEQIRLENENRLEKE